MQVLNNWYDSSVEAEALQKIETLFAEGKAGVTFWGEKIIRAPGSQSPEKLDDAVREALTLFNLVRPRPNKRRFFQLAGNIERLRREADEIVERSNLVTRTLAHFNPEALAEGLEGISC